MPIIRVGDDLIDDDTGEYAGPADSKLPVALETEADLVLYMRRLMEAEARVAAKTVEYKAILANIELMIKQEQRRVDWLKHRYQADAEALAYSQLPRKKDGTLAAKTFTCPWGQVSFRTSKAGISVANPDAALAYCKQFHPEAVKVTESVLISKLPASVVESYVAKERAPEGFEFKPERQTVTFTTVEEPK